MYTIRIELTEEEHEKIKNIFNNQCIQESVLNILRDRINYVTINHSFKYHLQSKSIYTIDNKKIKLTKIENELLYYLINFSINYENAFVDTKQLAIDVWKNENTSIFAIRNKIAAIRDKTFRNIIKSKNNIGYRINI